MFADRHFTRSGRWHKATTIASGDTTAPTITVGPAVSAITDSEATVTWTTDEDATGQVGYGLTAPGATGSIVVADSDLRTGNTTYVTVPKASLSLQAGDLVVIAATKCLAGSTFSQVSPTTGWTFLRNSTYTADAHQQMMVAYKVISSPTSEPTNWEFTRGAEGASYWAAVTTVLRGFASSVVDATLVYAEGTNDLTPDTPDITTVTAGALVLTGHHSATSAADRSSVTAGAPSGFSLVGGTKAATTWAWTAVASKTEASAGAKSYGAWTHAPDNATDEYQTWTLAIAPADTGSGSWTRVTEYANVSGFVGSLGTSHSIALSGLTADTTYHYAVESQDEAGNFVTSSDDTFATTAGSTGDPGGFPTTVTGRPVSSWGGSLSELGYLTETADPNFEGSIQRITPDGYDWRAEYPKQPAWNATGSLLVLGRSSGSIPLLHGTDYTQIRTLSVWAAGGTTWSASNPDIAWKTINGSNALYEVTPAQNTQRVIHTFAGVSSVSHSMSEGRPSNDDRYFAIYAGGTQMITYDRELDTEQRWTLPSSSVDWISMSPSGAYVVVRFLTAGTGSGQGVWAFTRSGNPVRNLAFGEHGDVASNAAGEDVFVGRGIINTSAWRARRMSDGVVTDVNFGVTDGHVSGVCYQLPGWVLISNHYPGNFAVAGADQIALCALDGSLDTRVFCHARTVQNADLWNNYNGYAYSTHAVVSPDGKRATWGGDWQRLTDYGSSAKGFVVRVAP